ncbi:hypothetical protein WR25_19884 [Diploscapter pachys]|uniref:Uncharacterized protein n=1 Tax=Diploscapter pachys TaxID=2018661 RepID=A0A2A2LBG6_9BILA|nr:hypothetical protein WR25_19884 [Diploscapter pachys]
MENILASRQAAVNKAIEQTKSRQSPAMSPARTMTKPNQGSMSPGRNEILDVERLNKLIRALDKTWILPRAGAKEPVGSNFQYKKTCSSIYKARHGACQQLGFGVMCFNYCHERGERLSFRCQDASDAAYCRQSGTFETFLAKYRKDPYKAKAYVHQMISRCYSTAICNTQSGLLNSTIIDEDGAVPERTTKGSGQIGSLKLLTRPPNGSGKKGSKKTTTTTMQPEIEEMPDEEYETTERTTRKPERKRLSSYKKTTPSQPPETTTRANIWDKFTVGQKAKPTPKYIPFWQRLLSTTTKSPRIEDISKTEEKETAEAEETESTQLPEEEVYESTLVTEEPETQETTRIAESTIIQKSYQKSNGDKKNSNTESPSQKHTFRIRTRLLEQIPAKSMVPM